MRQDRFHVYRFGRLYEVVYYDADMSAARVRRSLISHDRFPEDIIVKRAAPRGAKRKNPASRDATTVLNRLIVESMKTMWKPSVRRDSRLHAMTLGILVSRWAGYAGTPIITAFTEALEDSNYHAEAAAVRELFTK